MLGGLHHTMIKMQERYRYQWIVMPIFESHNSIGSFEIFVPGIRIRISLICGTRYQAQAWKIYISMDTGNNLGRY